MMLLEAKALALQLMSLHGLQEWTFRFDAAVRRFGVCKRTRKVISLSRNLTQLNEESRVRDVILHEIAHALAPARVHHGAEWKRIARSIGCDGLRCYDATVVLPKAKYKTLCNGCGKEGNANRRGNVACRECCNRHNNGHYDSRFQIVFQKQ